MAGPTAEGLFTGSRIHTGQWETDVLRIERETSRLVVYGMTLREAREEVRRLGEEVEAMLRAHWNEVEGVAAALLERGELSGAEISELMAGNPIR